MISTMRAWHSCEPQTGRLVQAGMDGVVQRRASWSCIAFVLLYISKQMERQGGQLAVTREWN